MNLFDYNKQKKLPGKNITFKPGMTVEYDNKLFTVEKVGNMLLTLKTGKLVNKLYCKPHDIQYF